MIVTTSPASERLRICVVTGSRADFGVLSPVMKAIRNDEGLDLFILAVGSHFLEGQGRTIDEVGDAGFTIDQSIVIDYDDSAAGISRAMGEIVQQSSDALAVLQPDVVLVLGDRFEVLSVSLAASVLRLPVAHIAGGDVTLGSYDEGFRHAITKLSHVHFTTNTAATARIRQLGEEPWRIHQVGSPGIDAILEADLLSRAELEERLSWKFHPRNLLVTLHPVTLQPDSAIPQAEALVSALEGLEADVGVVVTGTNADSEGAKIQSILKDYCSRQLERALYIESLGNLAYLSTLAQVDAVVGNSSSGLYEAPSLGVPTVDIGLRQVGRPRATSVFPCPSNAEDISLAIDEALACGKMRVSSPYGDGHAAEAIVDVLRSLPHRNILLLKAFVDCDMVDQ